MSQLPVHQPPPAVSQNELERLMRNYERRIAGLEALAIPVSGGITLGTQLYSTTGFVQLTTSPADDANFPFKGGMTRSGATLVVPVAGVYLIQATIAFATGSAGTTNRIAWGISTSPPLFSQDNRGTNAGVTNTSTFLVPLAVGDTVGLFGYTDTANSYANLSGWLRAALVR